MVTVKLHSVKASGAEEQIAMMLVNKIEKDTSALHCSYCYHDSEIILHIDNSKMSVLRTEVKPCCDAFARVLEESLFEGVPA